MYVWGFGAAYQLVPCADTFVDESDGGLLIETMPQTSLKVTENLPRSMRTCVWSMSLEVSGLPASASTKWTWQNEVPNDYRIPHDSRNAKLWDNR